MERGKNETRAWRGLAKHVSKNKPLNRIEGDKHWGGKGLGGCVKRITHPDGGGEKGTKVDRKQKTTKDERGLSGVNIL